MVQSLAIKTPTPPDIDIAQAQVPLPITEIAKELGLQDADYEQHGKTKAKVVVKEVLGRLGDAANGKYVCVAGISPTPLGEGKSTTTVGLCQALGAHLNTRVITCVRQPSQGKCVHNNHDSIEGFENPASGAEFPLPLI